MQYGTPGQDSPSVDLEHETNLQRFLVSVAAQKLIHSAHDISDGGLFVALAEKAIMHAEAPLGFTVDLENAENSLFRIQQQLFSEAQGRVVISISPDKSQEVIEAAAKYNVPLCAIGQVVAQEVSIALNGNKILAFTIDDLNNAYYHSLEHALHLDEL